MLPYGSVGIAVVHRQIVVVQAARPHDHRDRFLDVYTFTSMGLGVFLASAAPCASISVENLLIVFPEKDVFFMPARDVLELPQNAYHEYLTLSER
ncbi:hypothetical protein K488DRAFT_15493, partial [Vararia minispora EC-137]